MSNFNWLYRIHLLNYFEFVFTLLFSTTIPFRTTIALLNEANKNKKKNLIFNLVVVISGYVVDINLVVSYPFPECK